VGIGVGTGVGCLVGKAVGRGVVGRNVGRWVGGKVGLLVGEAVGEGVEQHSPSRLQELEGMSSGRSPELLQEQHPSQLQAFEPIEFPTKPVQESAAWQLIRSKEEEEEEEEVRRAEASGNKLGQHRLTFHFRSAKRKNGAQPEYHCNYFYQYTSYLQSALWLMLRRQSPTCNCCFQHFHSMTHKPSRRRN
jgi:hypothetical protein